MDVATAGFGGDPVRVDNVIIFRKTVRTVIYSTLFFLPVVLISLSKLYFVIIIVLLVIILLIVFR